MTKTDVEAALAHNEAEASVLETRLFELQGKGSDTQEAITKLLFARGRVVFWKSIHEKL